jgi:hypothetical protein
LWYLELSIDDWPYNPQFGQNFVFITQGAYEEVPHGHKGKIELFTISSFLQWGTNNNSSWDVGKDEWKIEFMERSRN